MYTTNPSVNRYTLNCPYPQTLPYKPHRPYTIHTLKRVRGGPPDPHYGNLI